MSEKHFCYICGKEFKEYPNNPAPLPGEECCKHCDDNVVLPIRMFLAGTIMGAMIITPGWSIKIVNSKKDFSLKDLQSFVEGYIEVYPKEDDKFVYLVDEEGLLKNKRSNILAKYMFDINCVGNIVVLRKELFK